MSNSRSKINEDMNSLESMNNNNSRGNMSKAQLTSSRSPPPSHYTPSYGGSINVPMGPPYPINNTGGVIMGGGRVGNGYSNNHMPPLPVHAQPYQFFSFPPPQNVNHLPPPGVFADPNMQKIVEVPQLQIMEKVMEVPQVVRREKIVRVPKVETVERTIPVPKTQFVEKIVEVLQYQYKEVPVEKVVTVPEIQTQVVLKEVDVPVNVDVPIPQPRQLPIEQAIERNIPVPVDVTTVQNYKMPQLKSKYKEVVVPIYVPRYVEVPVPAQFCLVDNLSDTIKTLKNTNNIPSNENMASFNNNTCNSSISQTNNNTNINTNNNTNNNMLYNMANGAPMNMNLINMLNNGYLQSGTGGGADTQNNTNLNNTLQTVEQTVGVLAFRDVSVNRSVRNEVIVGGLDAAFNLSNDISNLNVNNANINSANENDANSALNRTQNSSHPSCVPSQASSRQVSARQPVLVS